MEAVCYYSYICSGCHNYIELSYVDYIDFWRIVAITESPDPDPLYCKCCENKNRENKNWLKDGF